MKTIVVCGATGFIGRNLLEHFARIGGSRVVGVHHERPPFQLAGVEWVKADLTQLADAKRVVRGADVLIQAAATTSGAGDIVQRPHIHVTDNAVMNSLILREAFEAGVGHLVFFSCSIMLQSSAAPLTEEDFDAGAAMQPQYFGAGWTKVYLEKMCEFYSRIGKTRHTVIRHSNVYGPHDKFDLQRSHVLGATVTKVMTASKPAVTVWGSGEEARDLIYVDDLVDFVARALERQPGAFGLYNCGCGVATPVRELVAKVIEKSGKRLTIEYDRSKPSIPTSLALDCRKAERELGWRCKVPLDEGIARTIAWWKANMPAAG